MDLKTIVRDPQAAVTRVWGSPLACPVADDIEHLSSSIIELKRTIKQVKQRKGKLSGQFKEVTDKPEQRDELKNAMSAISTRLADLEQERKTLEANLLAHFETGDKSAAPDFPRRFHVDYPSPGSVADVTVDLIQDGDAASWDTYVTTHDRSSLYHLYAWKQVIETAFGHPCYYYAAKSRDSQIVGVLPLVEIKSHLFGNYAVSLPFFNYGGAIADSAAITSILLDAANAEADRRSWQHIEYRTCEEGHDLPCSNRKVSMILKLPASPDALDNTLRAKVRAQFKRARHHQPVIEFGGVELLEEYYQVFSRNMRDLGTPVYAKDFFETILNTLPDRCTLVSVRLEQKPVAVAFLLAYGDMLEIPWASTLREYNDYNINMWMYRQILGYAIEKGYGYFDFGRSTRDAGTYHFKKQWGAKALNHHWYYYLANSNGSKEATLPGLNPDNPKYRLAIAAWKRLPLFLANSIGPSLVKNLP